MSANPTPAPNRPVLVHDRTRPTFATVTWTVDDVLELRPDWTRADALRFLAENEHALRDRLIEHGWSIIENLIAMSA